MRILAKILIALLLPLSTARAGAICTVLADAESGQVLHSEGDCETRVTPASTFKVAIGLMGYDSGLLANEHSPALPFKEGYPDWIESWKAETDPGSWMKNSVVWYSQQITRSLGQERFRQYVEAFDYGNLDVSGDPGKDNGLTRAWLSSSLKISPLEQVAFLRALVRRQLPVSAHAFQMIDRITAVTALPGGWDVHGKTGSGAPRNADGSLNTKRSYGWFVGWARRGDVAIVFARLIQNEKKETVPPGPKARDAFLEELPTLLPP